MSKAIDLLSLIILGVIAVIAVMHLIHGDFTEWLVAKFKIEEVNR